MEQEPCVRAENIHESVRLPPARFGDSACKIRLMIPTKSGLTGHHPTTSRYSHIFRKILLHDNMWTYLQASSSSIKFEVRHGPLHAICPHHPSYSFGRRIDRVFPRVSCTILVEQHPLSSNTARINHQSRITLSGWSIPVPHG